LLKRLLLDVWEKFDSQGMFTALRGLLFRCLYASTGIFYKHDIIHLFLGFNIDNLSCELLEEVDHRFREPPPAPKLEPR